MSKNDRNDILNHGIAGTISGIARTFVISPIEVVKVQMQVVGQEKPMSVMECIRYIYQKAGFGGFSRGYLMCFMREPVAFATYFASFEWMTKYVLGFAVLPIFILHLPKIVAHKDAEISGFFRHSDFT